MPVIGAAAPPRFKTSARLEIEWLGAGKRFVRTYTRWEGSCPPDVFKVIRPKATGTSLDPELIDEAFDCYVLWREKRTAVRDAYAAWRQANTHDRDRAFHAYVSALDREEEAATEYERLVECARRAMV